MNQTPTVAIVDDEIKIRTVIGLALDKDFRVLATGSPIEASIWVIQEQIDLLILDLNLSHGYNGLDLLEFLRDVDPFMGVIILTGYGSFESAQKAIQLKVDEYVCKPFDLRDFRNACKKVANASYIRRTDKLPDNNALADIENSLRKFHDKTEDTREVNRRFIEFSLMMVNGAKMSLQKHDGFGRTNLTQALKDVLYVIYFNEDLLGKSPDVFVCANKTFLTKGLFNLLLAVEKPTRIFIQEDKAMKMKMATCGIVVSYDLVELRKSSYYHYCCKFLKNHEGMISMSDNLIEIMIPLYLN